MKNNLLVIKYRDAENESEIELDESEALGQAEALNHTFVEWAEVLNEDGTVIWDHINGSV